MISHPGDRRRGDLTPGGSAPTVVAMPASPPTRCRSPTAGWLDVGPLAAMVALLWAKLVYFSALLPSEWWAPEETIIQWMRPAFHFVSAVQAHPEVLAATLAGLLVLVASLLALPRLPRLLALLFLNLFLTSLGITDLVHVRFYADVVSLSDVVMAPMVLGVLPRVFESLSTLNALYYLDVVAGLLLLPWYLRACRRVPPLRRPARVGIGFAVLGAGLVLAVPTARMAWRSGPALLGYSNPRIELASAIGILPYHMGDLALRLAAGKPTIGEPERQRVDAVPGRSRARHAGRLSALRQRAREEPHRHQRRVAAGVPDGSADQRPAGHPAPVRLRAGEPSLHELPRPDAPRHHVRRRVRGHALASPARGRGALQPLRLQPAPGPPAHPRPSTGT